MKKQNNQQQNGLMELVEVNGNKAKFKLNALYYDVYSLMELLSQRVSLMDERFQELFRNLDEYFSSILNFPVENEFDFIDQYVIYEIEIIEEQDKGIMFKRNGLKNRNSGPL